MKYAIAPWWAFVLLGCAAGQVRAPAAGPKRACPCQAKSATDRPASGEPAVPAALDHARATVPVSPADPTWGSPDAPVTIVEWSDFQCPYCSRGAATIDALKRSYGPDRLRVVWKNLPLPFHPRARPAAEVAMAVFDLGGATAFWTFHDRVFASQDQLSDEHLLAWAAAAGLDPAAVKQGLATRKPRQKTDEDVALARRLGVEGTPVFRINGVALEGAQPEEAFRAIIDAQLAAAQELRAGGAPARGIYPALCARNAPAEALSAATASAAPEDTTIWSVPVDRDDPVRGPEDALVTLVVFSDFACPFCQRLEGTLAGLAQKYSADLRIVWKDYPLPFHPQALPAAVLARLASAKHGPDGFWRVHDALWQSSGAVDEAALKAVAARVGVPWFEVLAAMTDRRFQPAFDRSQALVKQLEVRGTPCSYVNGRRIEGALPAEVFETVIEAELEKARDLLEAGQPRAGLYALLTKTPQPEAEPERKTVEPPTRDNPTRGNAKAKVTIQMFGDFQCPESLRVMPKLVEIEKEFAGRVRLVWRNHPLVFHEDAGLAAEAAQEVFVQKGAAGFWRYHEMLFAAQTEGGLGRAHLEKLARKLGVDGKRWRAALDSHRHRPVIERDIQAANQAEMVEVPTVLINDYVITGIQPLEVFERTVKRSLAESEAGH